MASEKQPVKSRLVSVPKIILIHCYYYVFIKYIKSDIAKFDEHFSIDILYLFRRR